MVFCHALGNYMKQPPCLDRIFVAKNKSMHIKTLIALVSSLPLTIAVNFMKYIFQDWEFAKWIGIAIALDTIVSLVKHFFTKDISSETFWAKFAKKIFVYLILLIASNYLTNYTVNGHIIGPTLWIGEYICVYILNQCHHTDPAASPVKTAQRLQRARRIHQARRQEQQHHLRQRQ